MDDPQSTTASHFHLVSFARRRLAWYFWRFSQQ